MKDLINLIGVIVIIVFLIIFMVVLICIPILFYDKFQCSHYKSLTNTETKYSFFNVTCFLKINGEWIPYDRWVNATGQLKK